MQLFTVPAIATAETPPAAAIASAHPLATAAGIEILNAGGNAFDAAVAVSAALAVVEPGSSGLGGGGFWLLHRDSDGHQIMIDGRERAPQAATPALFIGPDGTVLRERLMDGPLAAAIPGVPAALDHLARHYGRLPLSRSLAPAIRLARDGFAADDKLTAMIRFRLDALRRSPAAAALFLVNDGPPAPGHIIRQHDLADTLQQLAQHGRDGFYRGPVARRLLDGVRAAGGIWQDSDLQHYQVVERAPLHGVYRGIKITAAPPPSSGGIGLLTMLNILSRYDLDRLPEATRIHLISEAMRRAYRDRAQYLGDPDFVAMPVERLIDADHAAAVAASIHLDRATRSTELPEVAPTTAGDGPDTSHFSILDRDGNRVAATLSINYPFGAAFVAPGTGVVLNDELDDFVIQPGTRIGYGLGGGAANLIQGGKRPLSSMTPTFVESDHQLAILGTPGGSRIISMVVLATLQLAAGQQAAAVVAAGRYHHQFLPDVISHEPGAIAPGVAATLQGLGHQLEATSRPYGNMQLILWDRRQRRVEAASDPRGIGAATVIPAIAATKP
ncbi:MAG: gamma-glutamyltransferase [Gammaproteobacteria bacterium]|nr:gamma-glutamyltransferase [Gammaproteobacteria bacterium]